MTSSLFPTATTTALDGYRVGNVADRLTLDRLGSQICSRGLAVFDGARDPEAMATLAGRLMSVTAHPDSDEHGVTTIAALGAAALESSPRRRLRPERRDGQDLILESAERAEAEDEALSMTSRCSSRWSRTMKEPALCSWLPDVFPWVRFLPIRSCTRRSRRPCLARVR